MGVGVGGNSSSITTGLSFIGLFLSSSEIMIGGVGAGSSIGGGDGKDFSSFQTPLKNSA